MKKLLCLLLALCMCFSLSMLLTACDDVAKNPNTEDDASKNPNTEDDASQNPSSENPAPEKESGSGSLRVMTYNLHAGANHTNRDFELIDMVLNLIEKYEPDIFGVQEATPNWMSSLRERFGDRYDSVGVGRYANGSGEACAIFYLKDRFEIVNNETGTKWLSLTPDVPGSYDFGSDYVRIYTYAKFKDKETGKIFVHVNTHLDVDDYACEEQADLLMQVCKEYENKGFPCIVTGDYNCAKGSEAYRILTNTGFLDSIDIAEQTQNKEALWVDHIFLSKGINVPYYQICTETYARANGETVQPSDHKPVFIDCVIP